jgi:hypothetical protein
VQGDGGLPATLAAGSAPGVANILDLAHQAGHPDRALVFASTSKITIAGGGLGLLAASDANIDWFVARSSKRTIGPDKVNQLRHVRFLRDHSGIERLMAQHRKLLEPKFKAVEAAFARRLAGTDFARWTKPLGGYFVSVDVYERCATRVVELAKQAGILMVPAGQTFPCRKDPHDSNLRIAPTFPELKDVSAGAEGIAICIEYAVAERLSSVLNHPRIRWATNGGSESRDSANASALPVRSISTASSTDVAAAIVVFFNVRPAARIVVVLAMPTTRTFGRSTSARVFMPEPPVTI